MSFRKITAAIALVAMSVGTSSVAIADPCGMVPPPSLQIATSATIERIGVQKTYVAFDKGMETMVLRPGFEGNVEEFGMLIPFPSPPEIRKVDDNIFSHLAAAVDPPEVIARVQRVRRFRGRPMMKSGASRAKRSAAPAAEMSLQFDEVRVVKQEAVGMYEVAVLAAGSSKSLKRWMDDNRFRYPKGMDTVIEDYVDSKWYFVAVKTKVGDKGKVNPRPGMRSANSARPAGTTFRGFVQAMGFRFRSKDLVVPMRLSVFNAKGNSRNIVYALTRGGKKISGIDEKFVVRQVDGLRLFRNVKDPLPLRVIGGSKEDLSDFQKQSLPARRDPSAHNGLAKELFGSDMLAMQRNRLANPLEEKAKALLNIGESLGLRGRQIDDLNRAQLKEERKKLSGSALNRLKSMTLTVIDGSFDRKVLAKDNLKFKRFRIASGKNTKMRYDAIQQGPGINMGGKVYKWQVAADTSASPNTDDERRVAAYTASGFGGGSDGGQLPVMPLALLVGLLGMGYFLSKSKKAHPALLASAVLLASGGIAYAKAPRFAQPPQLATSSVATLMAKAVDDKKPVAQGKAILALRDVGSEQARQGLSQISSSGSRSMLARTWATAAQMQMASTSQQLFAIQNLSRSFPATRRTWVAQFRKLMATKDVGEALDVYSRVPELRGEVQGLLAKLPTPKLIDQMLSASSQQARQQSAGALGSKGENAGRLVARALRFNKKASKTPWAGGPLYLPSVPWTKSAAKSVAGSLLRWMIWSENQNDAASARIAANNLMSQVLAKAAGYPPRSGQAAYSSELWLGVWAKAYGAKEMSKVLADVK